VCCVVAEAPARTWDLGPGGSGDAPSIAAAFALAAAGDTVRLAPGTYGEHDLFFPSGVTLLGGASPEEVIVDPGGLGRVLTCCEITSARIESLTFRAGIAQENGGSACAPGSRGSGGGVYAYLSELTVSRVRFEANETTGAFGKGGALRADGGAVVIEDCVFEDNRSTYGGAIYLALGAARIERCELRANAATFGGGALYAHQSPVIVTASRLVSNTAPRGGGAILSWHSDAIFTRCVVAGNEADAGGGVWCDIVSAPRFNSCTFAGNRAPDGAQLGAERAAPALNQCIVAFGELGLAIASTETVPLRCTDIFGNEGGDFAGGAAGLEGIEGNFRLDPQFCAEPGAEWTLRASSPCLPGNHVDGAGCGLIGAFGIGPCDGAVGVESATPSPRAAVSVRPTIARESVVITLGPGIPEDVPVAVVDASGRCVRTIGGLAESKRLRWNLTDVRGARLPPGVYVLAPEGSFAAARVVVLP